jgi:hypothetical protein
MPKWRRRWAVRDARVAGHNIAMKPGPGPAMAARRYRKDTPRRVRPTDRGDAQARSPTTRCSRGRHARIVRLLPLLETSPTRHAAGPHAPIPLGRGRRSQKVTRSYNKVISFRSRIALFHHENRAKNVKKRFLRILRPYGDTRPSAPASRTWTEERQAPQGRPLPPCQ